jgi:hypothetical protein
MVKLARLDDSHLLFMCPGCKCPHHVRIGGPGPVWEWNGSTILPTFEPDITFSAHNPEARCHFSIRDGAIEFFADSHHDFRGRLLVLPDWPEQPSQPEEGYTTK